METNATIIITLEDVLFETSQSELNFIRENKYNSNTCVVKN